MLPFLRRSAVTGIVYTLGHSNHAIGTFIELARQHRGTAIYDVRSQPYSRFNPQFRREALRGVLAESGISYMFLGQELGARSADPLCLVDGKVAYDRLAKTAFFRHGLERIVDGMTSHRIALICAERDPLRCHRTILVGRHLRERGIDVRHILADGSLERHGAAMERLLRELGMTEPDLFRPREAVEAEAYRRRGDAIAFEVPGSVSG